MIVQRTQRRFVKAINFIEQNLESKLTLSQVAAEVAMSSWYFSRLFSMLAGMPFGDYVRRRKLSEAANRLMSGEESILDVALRYEFASQQSFTRAFTQCFGCSPGEMRKANQIPANLQEVLIVSLNDSQPKSLSEAPVITQISEMYLCGPVNAFDMQSRVSGIPALWAEFVPRMMEIEGRVGDQTYGACISAGEHGEIFQYQAAVRVESDAKTPVGFEKVRVPEGSYAVFTHKGSAATIKDSMEYIWTLWLPGNGKWQHRSAPDFEFYDERFDPETGQGEMEIYVPVKEEAADTSG